ncbi:hypothetical protein EJ08DRAFT_557388, partial [Tothia fuscella]
MSESVTFAQYNLGYPPWALEFDPLNRGYLLVAGGGGEQKEVPNRLTLLDVSKRSQIENVADVNILEDSPSSLGLLSTKDGLYAYSGVNSTLADRQKGKNEHFRSFKIDYPARGTEKEGKITALGQTSLFSPSFYSNAKDQYQRLIRLSPAKKSTTGNKRIGAIANSWAPESEIVVFNATKAIPTTADVIQRILPVQNKEVEDLDIIELKDGEFALAYCTKNEVYFTSIDYHFTMRKPRAPLVEPQCLYSAPRPDTVQAPSRPKYRSIRFITPEYVLLLSNANGQSELQMLRIHGGASAEIILRKRLPRDMGLCVSMDVCLLDADADTGARQVVVAVAAQKQDITVYTLDYAGPVKETSSSFNTYKELRNVHKEQSMKKVVLSPFHSPWLATDTDKKTPSPQYLRMASISLSNTLCIDDLPLHPVNADKRGSRYALSKKNRLSAALSKGTPLFVIAFVLFIGLMLAQSLLSHQPGTSSVSFLPESWQNAIHAYQERAGIMAEPISRTAAPVVHSQTTQKILDMLHLHHKHNKHLPDPEKKAVIIRAPSQDGEGAELSTEVHSDTAELLKQEVDAKRWEDLSDHQRREWKRRLKDAGQWAEGLPETIFKGVFFSEIAGAIG